MSNFKLIKLPVKTKIERLLSNYQCFVVDVDKDELWDTYLSAFPEGTNPIYIERTEHDCNCCKQFIRDAGGIVAIVDGELQSIWDVDIDGFYGVVAKAMSKLVKSRPIKNVFKHHSATVGTNKTENFEHFFAKIPNNSFKYRESSKDIATVLATYETNYSLLKRGVSEITQESVDIVLELVAQNSIYRGVEYKNQLQEIKRILKGYSKAINKEFFLWETSANLGMVCRFKNSVIGTLLVDISSGMELEDAVKQFEHKVAPQNYKRSSSIVTKGMIEKAMKKVAELDIEDSLYRRHATEQDISINNVLFADRSIAPKIGGVFDGMLDSAPSKKPNLSKIEEVHIDDFIKDILPKVSTMEIMVDNSHSGNFMSLIAPKYNDARNILKWNNNFTWSYAGEVTDSIKQRVKSAGGDVNGYLRVSLSWDYSDDLDLHVKEPQGDHIYFGNKESRSTGGKLDVDMNAHTISKSPVENIVWKNKDRLLSGDYGVYVHNFRKRGSGEGFEIEIECSGEVHTLNYPKNVPDKKYIYAATLHVHNTGNVKVTPHIDTTAASKNIWGIATNTYTKVKMMMTSPNHWDGNCNGNKHYFFILDGCNNPDSPRGFYNEFLSNELTEHRKVFEVLSSKMKVEYNDSQLSGVGFSSTMKNHVLCKVSGSFNRVIKLKF